MWVLRLYECLYNDNKFKRPLAYLTAVTVLFSVLVQWLIGLNPYSGWKQEPMYGDFEAQRHWMEITYGLHPSHWYFFDLNYWGLDYPPLTAYHSFVLGALAHQINPLWVDLNDSRGLESVDLQHYMRLTAILSQLLVYTWFSWLLIRRLFSGTFATAATAQLVGFYVILFQPGLLLVDHGHFQYNSVMLGFAVGFIWAVCEERLLVGSVLFCLSLAFKQMSLFYALPIFAFLLGKCAQKRFPGNAFLLAKLALVVLSSFALTLAPMLASIPAKQWPRQIQQLLLRLFPVQRGLYEDKVANVWCAISVVVKLRKWFSISSLVAISTQLTLFLSLPSCVCCFQVAANLPQDQRLKSQFITLLFGLFSSSLAFFLFGFQVHEKSILLPLMPASVLLALTLSSQYTRQLNGAASQRQFRLVLVTFVNVACFSMYPLLCKDLLQLPYWTVMIFYNLSILDRSLLQVETPFQLFFSVSHAAMIVIHLAEVFLTPPRRLPHLFVMLNVVLSCAVFLAVWFYVQFLMWRFAALHPAYHKRTTSNPAQIQSKLEAVEPFALGAANPGEPPAMNLRKRKVNGKGTK